MKKDFEGRAEGEAKTRRPVVIVGTRLVWLAWYPLRGRRSQFGFDRTLSGGWHFSLALGPAYLGIGTGVPVA